MKIIDEKGRLFGKINVIDFLAIIFLLSLTPVFYFGYKIFIKKPIEVSAPVVVVAEQKVIAPKKDMIELELAFDLIKLSPDTAKLISVGDKEIDGNGQVLGEIIKLEKFGPQVYKIDIASVRPFINEDAVLKHILATIRIKAELKKSNIYYKDKQITTNSGIDFITDKYKIEAVCLPPSSVDIPENELSNLKCDISTIRDDINLIRNEMHSIRNLVSKAELSLKKHILEKDKSNNKKIR